MASVFDILLAPPLALRGPAARWDAAVSPSNPLESIVRASWGAATVGEAFYAGYQGALQVLVGSGSQALLVTEVTGQRPRDLKTTVRDGRIDGSKAFAMTGVNRWWVLARGEDDEVRLLCVAPSAPGVHITPMNTSFIADVPHGSVRFDDVPFDDEIPDAWARVVRPFRSVEDGCVVLALAVALLGAVDPPDEQETLLAVIAGCSAVFGRADDLAFRALCGLRSQLLEVASRAVIEGPLAASWEEYRPLVGLGQNARATRLERARQRTRSGPG